ncbi:hypothetical protein HYH03_016588 [Edaphochlamys debaryana]|uniref:protein-serine/threonine phosphatase n=1 Tax=Edaphochlamys debaryana TaxID=47281 RepID=A0A835XJP3_9CHLO|nr:hypothetical protein HYH03_016588 [Edaphochlamys debaryana]|eukprot:KAG2484635.1 hypothetical protein HYH03_016588 [Edaphochlamys debaryana]
MESPSSSQDDEALAAAFDGEFEEEHGEADDAAEEPPEADRIDLGEDGGSAGSDLDLDDLAEEGYKEVEELEREAGITHRPAKRQRRVTFASDEPGSPGAGPSSPGAGPSGSGPSGGMAGAGGKPSAAAAAACLHPVWVFGLCGVCGVSKEDLEQRAGDAYGHYLTPGGGGGPPAAGAGAVRLKHLHASKEVEISQGEAERVRRGAVSRLLSRKRLILILDLDHTLLNSVHMAEVGPDVEGQLAEVMRREEEANMGPRRLLHCLADKKLWTKLRPGVFEFLEGLREVYEMHIYTMGDKTYAAEVRRLLDPAGRLFSSVVAKDHSTTQTAKHLDVLLSADELALVLDDTEAVWPGHRRNLLQIERYHFFPSDLRKWRTDGTALLEQGRDESATAGALATHMRVLRAVHARFFSQDDPSLPPLEQRDVRLVLAELKAKILTGCRITFSRCWAQDKNPRSEPLWQMAEGLGATCLPAYDPHETTHVVAAAGGTAKVHQARSAGKAVVTPSWLQGCAFRWERLPEADFPVSEPGAGGEGRGVSGSGGGSGHGRSAGGGGAPGGGGGGAGGGRDGRLLSAEEELKLAIAAAGGGGGGGAAGGSGSQGPGNGGTGGAKAAG